MVLVSKCHCMLRFKWRLILRVNPDGPESVLSCSFLISPRRPLQQCGFFYVDSVFYVQRRNVINVNVSLSAARVLGTPAGVKRSSMLMVNADSNASFTLLGLFFCVPWKPMRQFLWQQR